MRFLYIAVALTTLGGILAEEASSTQAPRVAPAPIEILGSTLRFWLEARMDCGEGPAFEGSDAAIEARRLAYRDLRDQPEAISAPALRELNHAMACRQAEQEVRTDVARAVAAQFAGAQVVDLFDGPPVSFEGRRFTSRQEFAENLLPQLGLRRATGGELERALVAQLAVAFVRKHGVEKGGQAGVLEPAQKERLGALIAQLANRFSGMARELAVSPSGKSAPGAVPPRTPPVRGPG